MKHATTENGAASEAAALYALGALTQHEARSFEEHLSKGCTACAAELAGFARVAESLAFGVIPCEPPAGLREKLLASVAAESKETPRTEGHAPAGPQSNGSADFLIIRAGEGAWSETPDAGVFVKLLYVDAERDTVTTLVRMEPGARIPRHRHRGAEQCLVIAGDVSSGGHTMGAGDFNCSLTGSIHDELRTEGGALLFLVSPESYELLEQGGQF